MEKWKDPFKQDSESIHKSMGLEKFKSGLRIEVVDDPGLSKRLEQDASESEFSTGHFEKKKPITHRRIEPKDLLIKEDSEFYKLGGRFSVESELYKILEEIKENTLVSRKKSKKKFKPKAKKSKKKVTFDDQKSKIVMSEKGFLMVPNLVTPRNNRKLKKARLSQFVKMMNNNIPPSKRKIGTKSMSQIPEFSSPNFKTPKMMNSSSMSTFPSLAPKKGNFKIFQTLCYWREKSQK
ncbi:unnamed protein product [Moneuplotes crassus]|uniref:Uncharacterized protein n=1 Tax=Euplotes crassus TaxID=5936 RepID=A0AAD1U7B8_EUPCR|nr:unnamed protein product [Moneuplotes crassus]